MINNCTKSTHIFRPLFGWKIQLIVLFYISYFLFAIIGFGLWIFRETGESLYDSIYAAYFSNLLVLPISFVILVFIPIGILRKRMVRKVEVVSNSSSSVVKIKYKGRVNEYSSSDIVYSFSDYGFYYVLVFYRRFINSRGFQIDDEIYSIVGGEYGLGWNYGIMSKLEKSLKEGKVECVKESSKRNILTQLIKL